MYKFVGWKRAVRLAVGLTALIISLSTLTGCLYPDDQLKQNQGAPKEAVRNVQGAVDQYFADKGMLPILNSSTEIPIYEKFMIDFPKLTLNGYISSIPASAFENGGSYYFLIIDEETTPRVKLMDILNSQRVNDIQGWVREHRLRGSELPKGEPVYPGFYTIDFKAMNRTAPVIQSMFSGQSLGTIIDDNGIVYIDYAIDIMQLLQRGVDKAVDDSIDLRTLLVDSSDYVPVRSPLYKLVNSEPQAFQP